MCGHIWLRGVAQRNLQLKNCKESSKNITSLNVSISIHFDSRVLRNSAISTLRYAPCVESETIEILSDYVLHFLLTQSLNLSSPHRAPPPPSPSAPNLQSGHSVKWYNSWQARCCSTMCFFIMKSSFSILFSSKEALSLRVKRRRMLKEAWQRRNYEHSVDGAYFSAQVRILLPCFWSLEKFFTSGNLLFRLLYLDISKYLQEWLREGFTIAYFIPPLYFKIF